MYSDIHSYQFFFYEYIQTFVCAKFVSTNIFIHECVKSRCIPDICHFFYTGSIFTFKILHPKIDLKHPKTLKNVPEK